MNFDENRKLAEKQGSEDGKNWTPISTQYSGQKFTAWNTLEFKFYRMVFFSVTGETATVNMIWKSKKAN